MKTSRRKFIEQGLKATLVTTLASPVLSHAANLAETTEAFQFKQFALPYAYNALEPYIDAQTMEIHYSKHHATYLKNINETMTAEKSMQKTKRIFSKRFLRCQRSPQ